MFSNHKAHDELPGAHTHKRIRVHMLTHLLTHCTYYVPGRGLGTWHLEVNKMDAAPAICSISEVCLGCTASLLERNLNNRFKENGPQENF